MNHILDWPLFFHLKHNKVLIASTWADSSFSLVGTFLCKMQKRYHVLFISYNTGGWIFFFIFFLLYQSSVNNL